MKAFLCLGSEVGISGIDLRNVVEMGRLAPGEMIAVDTSGGSLLHDSDIKAMLAGRKPYGEWLENNLVRFEHLDAETGFGRNRTSSIFSL